MIPKIDVVAHIFTGAERAQTGAELSARLGVSIRCISAAVARERRAGVPICADMRGGYYLASDAAELDAYLDTLRRRIDKYRRVLSALEKADGGG